MNFEKEIHIQGVSLSKGIAIGLSFFLQRSEPESVPEFSVSVSDVDREIARYRKALFSSCKDLESIQNHLRKEGSSEAVTIFDTHIQMLHDPMITMNVEEKIREEGQNTEAAFTSVITEYKNRFSKTTDSFFLERLADVTDVSKRVLGHLTSTKKTQIQKIPEGSIIFAAEVSPSETAEAHSQVVVGIVTEVGGPTSHAAMIANAKGIPFITGIDMKQVKDHPLQLMIIDGFQGKLILNPLPETLSTYKKMKKQLSSQEEEIERDANLHAETEDGHGVHVLANIGCISDLEGLTRQGAGGIGLVRTEYFFLQNRSFLLSEQKQYLTYVKCIEKAEGLPVVIRVFDLGGDKFSDASFSKEDNPFLGCRGIRFLLRNKEIFKIQFRAILRAAIHGDVHILLPLISDVKEVMQAKEIFENVKEEMLCEEETIRGDIPFGCMIEVPSAVLTSDILAKQCDFFSIGTNDLLQYTLAFDRTNPAVHSLHDPFHPSLLRMISHLVKEAKKQKKRVSICGEIAYKPFFIPLLLGLGIIHFSCPPRYIPHVKKVIRKCNLKESTKLAQKCLKMSTSTQIYEYLSQRYRGEIPEDF